jgi:hypothetical protein
MPREVADQGVEVSFEMASAKWAEDAIGARVPAGPGCFPPPQICLGGSLSGEEHMATAHG